ncbi:MAG: hypothetical protein ACI89U_003358, partial [Gammaproteobacteria bacterium]
FATPVAMNMPYGLNLNNCDQHTQVWQVLRFSC